MLWSDRINEFRQQANNNSKVRNSSFYFVHREKKIIFKDTDKQQISSGERRRRRSSSSVISGLKREKKEETKASGIERHQHCSCKIEKCIIIMMTMDIGKPTIAAISVVRSTAAIQPHSSSMTAANTNDIKQQFKWVLFFILHGNENHLRICHYRFQWWIWVEKKNRPEKQITRRLRDVYIRKAICHVRLCVHSF